MKNYIGVGVSIGVLAGIWTALSTNITSITLITWVGFAAWACYFAAGGGVTGLRNGLLSNLSGAVYGWLVVEFISHVAFKGNLAIAVGVIAVAMCLQAGWAPLSFIPGAFVGAASFFGAQFAFWPTVTALVVGALFGFASGVLGEKIQAAVVRPAPAEVPTAPAV
ncbi:DUF1097 domain-containing protein [Lapillicoccus jejuensis]|uniref:Uncharacterized protein DUF1097 n=1 Tax=Lapillicoccus jejuensis TaxID=402171 RepID=A0A542DV68_9MICO|nr:DUF1097 domain-containing protein [Lapillicoccus jejuensis]TQJ06993.1 uncharacterized protein DUF1097 [Lapillicoccus jejuensis]